MRRCLIRLGLGMRETLDSGLLIASCDGVYFERERGEDARNAPLLLLLRLQFGHIYIRKNSSLQIPHNIKRSSNHTDIFT
jgi:hypothetical protein